MRPLSSYVQASSHTGQHWPVPQLQASSPPSAIYNSDEGSAEGENQPKRSVKQKPKVCSSLPAATSLAVEMIGEMQRLPSVIQNNQTAGLLLTGFKAPMDVGSTIEPKYKHRKPQEHTYLMLTCLLVAMKQAWCQVHPVQADHVPFSMTRSPRICAASTWLPD